MLKRAWKKIDRFYMILAIVLVVLAVPLVYTVQGIFGAFITAFEVDPSVGNEVRIDKMMLDDAVKAVYDKEVPPFEVKESTLFTNRQVPVEDEGL